MKVPFSNFKIKKKTEADSYKVRFDLIGGTFIFLSALTFAFGLTWKDPLAISLGVLLALSIGLADMFDTVQWDKWIDPEEWFWIMAWTIIDLSVVAITYFFIDLLFHGYWFSIPKVAGQTVEQAFWLGKFGSMLTGVTEEVLFGMVVFPWWNRIVNGFYPLALAVNVGFFVVFHFFVYGGNLMALLVVGSARVILTLSVWFTGRSTSSILAHGGWNFIVG